MKKTKKTILKYFDEYLKNDRYELSQENLSEVIDRILDVGEYVNEVEEIYKLYPTKCPICARSTGKTKKNKRKIAILLRDEYSFNILKSVIKRYLLECSKTNTWIQNFGTFLNNIPDHGLEEDTKPAFYIEYMNRMYVPEGFDSEGKPTHSDFVVKKLLIKEWIKQQQQ